MNRSVLVTGTFTGIGAACVEQLAGAGWTVFAGVGRSADGDRLVDQIAGDVRPVILDVATTIRSRRRLTRFVPPSTVAGSRAWSTTPGSALAGPWS